MNDTTIGRDINMLGSTPGQSSNLPPQFAAELDKAVGVPATEQPLQVPFVHTDAPAAPGPLPEVADATPNLGQPQPEAPAPVDRHVAVEAGQDAGSTPLSPEQPRFHETPANDAKPAPTPKPTQESRMASNFDYNRTTETMRDAAQDTTHKLQQGMGQAADTMRKQTEDMSRQGQQAMAQVTERSREAMDKGMKAFEEFNTSARGNADALMASSRAAAQGIEQIVQQTAEYTRKAFESATSAMRTMASARTPQDVMQAQNEFAKSQFDNMVGEFSRMTETMMKVANQAFEPIQHQMSDAATKASDQVKGMMNTGGQTR